MLGFRRDVDVIKALEGPHPSHPKILWRVSAEATSDEQQAEGMRCVRAQRRPVNNANDRAKNQKRQTRAGYHCQSINC